MYRDFDDFEDEHEHIRLKHYDSLDYDQYGEGYDPNAESFYDLDIFSLDHAKSLFHGLGNEARYKGFNRVGDKCEQGVREGCSQDEYEDFVRMRAEIDAAYADKPFNLFDTRIEPDEIEPHIAELNEKFASVREKCLFGQCDPCTEEEYGDYVKSIYKAQSDDPHDLYHPNNQTILDASTMPDTPVDPEAFLIRVSAELSANNVLISNDMPDLLERMCRLFNFSIAPNQELPITVKNLVFPAQTGIGKSVSLQVYVSMLEQNSSVIVVAKVEEAINYCNYINQLSGDENYARCYYALTDKNKDDPVRVEVSKLKSYRCILITHNMFRRVNGFDKIELFSHYQGANRNFVAIDEKLAFFEQFKLTYKQLDQLISNVSDALDQSKNLKDVVTSQEALDLLKAFKDFLITKDDKIITDSKSLVLKEHLGIDLETELNAIGEELVFSEHSGEFPKKIVGLKDKETALLKIQALHIPTQARKRMVIGVAFMEVLRKFTGCLNGVDEYYCEKLDSNLGNCKERVNELEPTTNDVSCEEDEFNFKAIETQVEKLMNHVEQDEQEGIFYESSLTLAASIIKVLLTVRTDELFQSLEGLGAYKNPNYKQNTLSKIDELTSTLKYITANHFLIYKTNYETALLATTNLVNQLGVSVVLDATAQFSEYYKLANRFLGHVGFVTAPQIRKYENLTINKAIGFNQSRSAIYKHEPDKVKEIAKSYASYALSELDTDDKMLIICHKSFTTYLRKHINDSRIQFTHWGNHVGRNNWSDCNKVMLIGWNYLPPISHVATINSSLESVLLTSRHLDEELIARFDVSQLADDLVQGLMRSQARVIATEDSDCKETSFYLFYQDDEKSKKVLNIVESQFPMANIIDWSPQGLAIPKKKTKPSKNADLIIDLLVEKAKDYQNYLRADVEKDTGINKSTMSRILKGDYFLDKLDEHGFIYKNRDGKSKHFILR